MGYFKEEQVEQAVKNLMLESGMIQQNFFADDESEEVDLSCLDWIDSCEVSQNAEEPDLLTLSLQLLC